MLAWPRHKIYRDAKEFSCQDKSNFNAMFKIITIDDKISMLNKIPNKKKKREERKKGKNSKCHAEPNRYLKPKEKSASMTLSLFRILIFCTTWIFFFALVIFSPTLLH